MKFDWLLDLLPAESATPAPIGVAPGVAEKAAVRGATWTPADEVPHLPHLPHLKSSEAASNEFPDQYARAREAGQADLAERVSERAAILEYEGEMNRAEAEVKAVRIVQCSTCCHWTADPLGGGGIGTCATGADASSWSSRDDRPLPPWPAAPRYCTRWEA